MNKLEIIQEVYGKDYVFTETELSRLLRVAELVRADEREACAQVCEDLIGTRAMARHCADEIRARGGEK
jgi:hypothetical protein